MTKPVLNEGDRIFRYQVPVDDKWHLFNLAGDPLHVACRTVDVVEFWARAVDGPDAVEHSLPRLFTVVGTGHPMSANVRYWGTVPVGALVWHLVERWPS